jgi:hypothetical protein
MHLQFHHVRFSRGEDDYVISAEATQLGSSPPPSTEEPLSLSR